ncbi:MAG: alkaline phosphatase [Deltaproteobacteria bacterium]|nr:alkaline phosphatase [Deltaproteobacteria bacterium]
MYERFSLRKRSILIFVLLFSLSSETAFSAEPGVGEKEKSSADWMRAGREAAQHAARKEPLSTPAKNIILFIGDGMGISTVTATRILEGQLRGESGEENILSFETFPYTALIKTYNTDQQTADSAGTMTALMTGVKTRAGVIGMGPELARGATENLASFQLKSLLEHAEASGRSTGIVTTTRITHATPAACYAHSSERNWESDADLPAAAQAKDIPDIARQLIEFPARAQARGSASDGIEVALGGGREAFHPGSTVGWGGGRAGKRRDGRNLTREWLQQEKSAYVSTAKDLAALDLAEVQHLLGLFSVSNMEYAHRRETEAAEEPSLPQMTQAALQILERNERGYFLMVEGGRIDHAHHTGSAFLALHETLEFAEAVGVALEQSDPEETLILVTADHSHVMNMGGYSTRGNPILGVVRGNDPHGNPKPELARDREGRPYTTLNYGNGPGASEKFPRLVEADSEEAALTAQAPDYRQAAAVPLKKETHGGEDVTLYATGPKSHIFHGVLEQNVVFHLIMEALQMNTAEHSPVDKE